MGDGKDDVIKRRQMTSRISAQWKLHNRLRLFFHWLYMRGVLQCRICINIKNTVIRCLQFLPRG